VIVAAAQRRHPYGPPANQCDERSSLWYAYLVPTTIRTLTPDEWPLVVEVDSNAFGFTVEPEIMEEEKSVVEWERLSGSFDGDALVGLAAIYSFDVSVPGGRQPVAAVTWVGVLPTHRRRGVLTGLMTHQLHGLHDTGVEPVAMLWASEPVIYGRFGYGLASLRLALTVPRSPSAVRRDALDGVDLRLRLHPAEDWKAVRPAYEAMAATRPGMIWRNDTWHERGVQDVASAREGYSALRCVVAEDDDDIHGYARYATKQNWQAGGPNGTVRVRELVAADTATEAALLRYLADLDLMAEVELWNLPVDDAAWHLLTDPRRAQPRVSDGLYLRLVDVDRALATRGYTTDVDVVLDVRDPFCPWNEGRWRLRGGPEGATCERTDADADLALPVTSLGGAYLGGTTLAELGRARLVEEVRPGALAAASRAFAHDPKPWCPFIF
jgi:predicted acetyltransferase